MTSRCISRSVSLISALIAGCGGPRSATHAPAPAPAPPASAHDVADVALVGGDIWTSDPAYPRAQAVAWRGDKVIALGDDAAVRAVAGPATKIIELHGRSASAGLIDAHCHLYELGADLEAVSVRGLTSEAATVATVAQAAKGKSPDGRGMSPGVSAAEGRRGSVDQAPWIVGRGWDQNLWPGQTFPTRATIDRVIADRPVVLERIDGHALWVNSAALAAANITRATPDPAGGKIVRDARGEPTGVLIDNAEELVFKVAPPASPERRAQRLRAASAVAVAAGLTAVHEMGIEEDTAAAYRQLAAAHQLPLRVHAYLAQPADPARLATPPGPPVGRFELRGVKLFADGALGSRGARLYAPYRDDPKNLGLWRTEPARLSQLVEAAVAGGWQVAIHAIGDAAVGAVLDAYLAAEQAHPGDHRLRIEHTQIIAPKDVPRMVAAHAIASMQPTHATSDMGWAEARIGPERIAGAYAWRTMLDHGVPVAAGSDFPVERVSPILGLYAAVTRQDAAGKPAGGWYPQQKMTLAEALDAFTRGAAYAEGAEATRGMLAVGRAADITVYSGALAADRSLLDLAIDYTIVDGEIVYHREPASP